VIKFVIEIVEKLLTAKNKYYKTTKQELVEYCDRYLTSDTEIKGLK
jgi:hypothetical protein